MGTILFVMTASDTWTLRDGSTRRTGYWADEAVVPYEAFTAAGHTVQVATPGGAVPPVDPGSLAPGAAGGAGAAEHLAHVVATAPELRSPIALADVDPTRYAAVFVPGGHGPMEDLAVDADAGRVLTAALDAGVPVGVVCHGPAALLPALRPDGTHAFAGYRVTGFTNAEEELAGTAGLAPWLLQDRLAAAGLEVVVGEPFAPHVQVDRAVVTGQNPASSAGVAEALLALVA